MTRRLSTLLVLLVAVALCAGCSGLIDGSPWGHVEGRVGGAGANPCDRCAPPAAAAPTRAPRLVNVK